MLIRLVLSLLWLAPLASHAATWAVQPGQAIQPAIERAAAGDTVEVQRGNYTGNLVIAKPLTLRGIQRPTISGGQQGDTIRVKSPDVTIEGLIVRDSGDSLLAQNAGIYLPARIARWYGTTTSPTTCSGCGSRRPTMFASNTT
jgi:nitrous oxidase accessory protein